MAVYQVQSNGQAPPGLSPGDYVNTAGGMYMVVSPGTPGSSYNPSSGYWSVKYDAAQDYNAPAQIQSLISSAQRQAEQNSQLSQSFAREQMGFQQQQIDQLMAFNATSAREAMDFSAQQAQINREFQERLSSTAHQREVADLLAAGLNPILSAGGSGASTPSGAAAAGVSASGAAASGASGTVDNSVTSAISNILATAMSTQASQNIAKLQTAATMYAADRGLMGSQAVAAGTVAASANSAAAARYSADTAAGTQRWIAENYPATIPQGIANIVNGINDIVGGNSNSGNAVARLVGTMSNGVSKLRGSFSSEPKNINRY